MMGQQKELKILFFNNKLYLVYNLQRLRSMLLPLMRTKHSRYFVLCCNNWLSMWHLCAEAMRCKPSFNLYFI